MDNLPHIWIVQFEGGSASLWESRKGESLVDEFISKRTSAFWIVSRYECYDAFQIPLRLRG